MVSVPSRRAGGFGKRLPGLLAASCRDLGDDAQAGKFRSDLYYRLSGDTLVLQPLAERPEDILPLAETFMRRLAPGESPRAISSDAARALLGYAWPGNARELRNTIERALAVANGPELQLADLPD